MKIVETDMYGRDYPDEKEVNLPRLPKEQTRWIADAINYAVGPSNRYWKVVEDDYELQPGFEP